MKLRVKEVVSPATSLPTMSSLRLSSLGTAAFPAGGDGGFRTLVLKNSTSHFIHKVIQFEDTDIRSFHSLF